MSGSTPSPRTRTELPPETRDRIMKAATEEFIAEGYLAASTFKIARRAGVSSGMLSRAYRTKPELFRSAWSAAVFGTEKLPPPLQAFSFAIRKAATGPAMLQAFCEGNGLILERSAVFNGIAEAAIHQREVAQLLESSERIRRKRIRNFASELHGRFGLKPGVDITRATDLLMLLAGSQTYRTLTSYGWSRDEIVEWAVTTSAAQLLPRPKGR